MRCIYCGSYNIKPYKKEGFSLSNLLFGKQSTGIYECLDCGGRFGLKG
ncbi:MAG: hypothetical protein J7K22_01005 [Nanoarchaeota archaeon]|nr:hypothetical protein [Nanoarchaeota archaeon]